MAKSRTSKSKTRILKKAPAGIRRRHVLLEYEHTVRSLDALARGMTAGKMVRPDFDGKKVFRQLEARQSTLTREMRTLGRLHARAARSRPRGLRPRLQGAILVRRLRDRQYLRQRPGCPSLAGLSVIEDYQTLVVPGSSENQPDVSVGVDIDDVTVSFYASETSPVTTQFGIPSASPRYFDLAALFEFSFPRPACTSTLEFSLLATGASNVVYNPIPVSFPVFLVNHASWRMAVSIYVDADWSLGSSYPALDLFTPLWERSGEYSTSPLSSPEWNTGPFGTIEVAGEFDVAPNAASRLFVALQAEASVTAGELLMDPSSTYLSLLIPDNAQDTVGVLYGIRAKPRKLPG